MTATPPTSLARRLLKLFLVVVGGGVLDLRADLLHTAFDVADLPAPSMIVVLSLSMTTFLAAAEVLKLDILELDAEVFVMALPPVSVAMSSSMALRRSPKPGALTRRTAAVPRSLLTTRVASASPSTSSGDDQEGLAHLGGSGSSNGSRSFMELIFFS